MKRNKGITLIALIITIIVMLILVAVSVNVIIKSNLIGTAGKEKMPDIKAGEKASKNSNYKKNFGNKKSAEEQKRR